MRGMTSRASALAPASYLTRQGLPLALLAVLAPTLLALDDPPSITFYNQVLGVFGWGLWMAWLARQTVHLPAQRAQHGGALTAISAVLWLTAGSALGSVWATGLPLGLGLMAATLALSAWWVLHSAWRTAHRIDVSELMDLFALGLAWTGVVSVAMSILQVFLPEWCDGRLIAEPSVVGRAVGNLRQPNHLSTLLIWCACGAAWLGRRGRWPREAAMVLIVMCIGGVVWSASRTGMVAMLLLTIWGIRDKHLPRPIRWLLIGAPLVYAAWWQGMAWWAHLGSGHAFAAEARLNDGSDISSSRFKIWANTWELIQAHPLTGVGWGEFNLAWTFTEFPTRPVAFFDHTHNLIMQWAVELGLPLTVVLIGLSAWGLLALWWPWRSEHPEHNGVMAVTATMVSLAALHSLLEYPLWYSYFLLPAAFAFGLGLAAAAHARALAAPATPDDTLPATGQGWPAAAAGLAMALGAVWCAVDYQWAANIYAPRPWAGPLSERISAGQHTVWFAYQADYAHATGPDDDEPSLPPQAFRRTLHNLVDARLMIAYARSLAEHGEVDKARYVVQRLKEFRRDTGDEFLAVCDDAPPSGPDRPFQCDPPTQRYTWRQVLPR